MKNNNMKKLNWWQRLKLKVASLATLLKKPAGIAVRVVDLIKRAVESDAAALIVSLTRTTVDDHVREALRRILPGVAVKLQLVNDFLNESDSEHVLRNLVDMLKKLDEKDRAEAYTNLAAMVFHCLENDGAVDFKEAVALTQAVYEILKAKGAIK